MIKHNLRPQNARPRWHVRMLFVCAALWMTTNLAGCASGVRYVTTPASCPRLAPIPDDLRLENLPRYGQIICRELLEPDSTARDVCSDAPDSWKLIAPLPDSGHE